MQEKIVSAVEKAIDQLITTFQDNPKRGWNERDLHWLLFHYLRQQEIFTEKQAIKLIRAEFPTSMKPSDKRSARGHYDLVILNTESLETPVIAAMEPWDPWGPFLDSVEIQVAIELKLWTDRQKKNLDKLIQWDIDKLTDNQNTSGRGYFLNFVQIDFDKPRMREFYEILRGHLIERHDPGLKILCVPHDKEIQPDHKLNWIG